MHGLIPYTMNVGGRLMDLSEPQVMGILNVTPDSFCEGSRKQTEREIRERAEEIVSEGASIIDIGAQSTRPGAQDIGEREETERLVRALDIVRGDHPDAVISIDTFRSGVARHCVERYGADIINDISGGDADPDMFATAAGLGVPYVLTHIKGTPEDMQRDPHYDHLVPEVMLYLSERVARLRELGQRDIILDPGFGFGKTIEHNYELMRHLGTLREFGLPLLVGVSRKSMVSRLLGCTTSEALNGTTALHAVALMHGANILRAHDVRAAVETIKIVRACSQ